MIRMALFGALLMTLPAFAGANLLTNRTFSDGRAAWFDYPDGINASVTDAGVLRIAVGDDDKADDWYQVDQRFTAKAGDRFALHVETQALDLREGNGLCVSLAFYDGQKQRIECVDYYQRMDSEEWADAVCRGTAPAGTDHGVVHLMLNGRGEARFRNPVLLAAEGIPTQTPDGHATLTVTDEVVCPALIGFGAEDDGWAYNQRNRDHGADEAGFALRESRIAWMQPDWVRMFFWYNDWNPSLVGENYTWDSDNMRSHYRTLDLYQRLGTQVTLTGVEWSVNDPWGDPVMLARAVGDLLEHLTVTKGYTCVKYWTLSNEPNLAFAGGSGPGWDRFVALHTLVKSEIERRGLGVKIMGSDDADGLDWFKTAVRDDTYFALTDVFASHVYFPEASLGFLPDLFRDHLGPLAARIPKKPFVIAEFGFRDARFVPPMTNPFMEDYPYALRAQATCITGLNEGVAGFNIWCMHEVYYPGGGAPMGFGLWNFADRDWSVRPVYHSMANFMRYTKAGDTVSRMKLAML